MSLISSVYIATSLDGFIARENDDLDWLDAANATVPEGEDCGYQDFMSSVDALVMGRSSYEKVLSFGAWPYDKPVTVLSRNSLDIPAAISHRVFHSNETPAALHQRLSQQGVRRLYVDGGITIQRFLSAGLIDDITITVIPVILGSGKPLFGPLEKDIALRHVATKTYDCGFVQSTYTVIKT
ncbi:dihydrofolate reductase [Exilibacterium tricleocarpae]|uniref:Dihydrofolate reductase n=1 Tax=Exilibacterium tricleocarpae TaxID=2591008 RepID=A0A545TS50_9GAMM|nr:dihydrofolate reductase family protein [Exilibacterium tricleocarpae]TQV80039.1 dihydrofolate reductase [Exilibacterium tricleocarpae]